MNVEKILKIQNGAKSLMWGCTRHSETETMFAVGHKSYPNEVLYFIVSDDFEVSLVSADHKKLPRDRFSNEREVIAWVVELLKDAFPAKGVD